MEIRHICVIFDVWGREMFEKGAWRFGAMEPALQKMDQQLLSTRDPLFALNASALAAEGAAYFTFQKF